MNQKQRDIEIARDNVARLLTVYRAQQSKALCETSLKEFVKQAWPVVESGIPFVPGWHIDAICEHLEALARRDIRKLIINISRRSAKSTIVSVMFPAWRWITHPPERFLTASYQFGISIRDSRKCRNLIRGDWYQQRWSQNFTISKDQNEKGLFENNKGGSRLATSADGGNLGHGGSCLDGSVFITTDQGPIPIQRIVDERLRVRVLGSSGTFQEIRAYSKTPGTELLEFEFTTGEKLLCTENHPIFTENGGYVPATVVESRWKHRSQYANLYLRHLPCTLRAPSRPRGSRQTRPILFQSVLQRFSARRKESRMEGWTSNKNLSEVRDGLSVQDWGIGRPRVLQPQLRDARRVGRLQTIGQGMSILQKAIQATQPTLAILLRDVRELSTSGTYSRCGERSIRTRRGGGREVWSRFLKITEKRDQGSRRACMCHLRRNIQARYFTRTSLRRQQNESRSKESCNSLRELSSNGTHVFGNSQRVDERAWIKNVRRRPAPLYVYNLEVAPDNDYYANGILTHNCMILDDCNDLDTIDNKAIRQGTIDWYDGIMASNFVDPKTDVRLNIQQRGHQEDLTAHLLELGGWELLTIPMEYEGSSKVTSIGWSDPRTKIGELMQPARFDAAEIESMKKILGPHRYAGQCQQRPSAAEGGQLRRDYWKYWNPAGTETAKVKVKSGADVIERAPVQLPLAFEQVVLSFDCTFKDMEHNDFVAGHAWGRVGANIYLLARRHGHFDLPKTMKVVREMSAEFPCPEKLIEDKANGPAVIQMLKNEIPGLIAVDPKGGKIARVNAMSGYAEAGNIYLPNPDLFPWVKDLINEFADFPASKHDDDTDAMSQACLRLFDSVSNSAFPEWRVMPRVGEPETACHIEDDAKMAANLPSHWRRWIAVSPGQIGAAVWIAETPSGALRVYREMNLEGMDAFEVGRRIAEATLPDISGFLRSVHSTAKWQIDVLLEKIAFAPVDPIGCYAELLEQGILGYDPNTGTFDDRQRIKSELKQAKFSAQMGALEDAAFDRLRDLLRFKPVDYEELPYDRKKALKLADVDMQAYTKYMNAVQGIIPGDYPRLKIAASCKQVIAAMGANRRDSEITDPFMRALLIGLTAPPQPQGLKGVREVPAHLLSKPATFNRMRRVN